MANLPELVFVLWIPDRGTTGDDLGRLEGGRGERILLGRQGRDFMASMARFVIWFLSGDTGIDKFNRDGAQKDLLDEGG